MGNRTGVVMGLGDGRDGGRNTGTPGLRGYRRVVAWVVLLTQVVVQPVVSLAQAQVLTQGQASTQVVPVDVGRTQVYTNPNGVPIVNITGANAQGVSHNRYGTFSVDHKGLVLNNNANLFGAMGGVNTQLAGSVLANPNLAVPAKIILNEVVGANRSQLNGFLEVAGTNADVVVANQNGIDCNGCGFLNAGRATLTTGAPRLDDTGALTGYGVLQGDIAIGSGGLNASDPRVVSLVARGISVQGQVNAQDLSVLAGTGEYEELTQGIRPVQGVQPVQLADGTLGYAIDAGRLGGMYADRIRIIATDEGAGVRVQGATPSKSRATRATSRSIPTGRSSLLPKAIPWRLGSKAR